MATVALFGKRIPDEARAFVEQALLTLKEEGAKILMHDRLQKQLNERWGLAIDHDTFHDEKDFSEKSPDFLISIGGDGTLLDATTLVERTGVPIIGLNTGRLGFLANIAREEASDAIRKVLKGQYTLDPRYCMEVSAEGGSQTIQPNFALNELAVSRKGTTSMISIHVYVNGQFLNTYWADGLIISTPTGSTGYNLSCGGPILMPGSDNFILTPIAPHNLTVRPLVIPNSDTLTLKVDAREGQFLASLDSRVFTLDCEVELTLKKADFQFQLVRMEDSNFATTLRNKLLWGLDRRN